MRFGQALELLLEARGFTCKDDVEEDSNVALAEHLLGRSISHKRSMLGQVGL